MFNCINCILNVTCWNDFCYVYMAITFRIVDSLQYVFVDSIGKNEHFHNNVLEKQQYTADIN